MIPNYSSAIILNNLIKSYDQILKIKKISQSIENYCLSFDDENMALKLAYGLSVIESNNSNYNKNCLNFGKGIIKITENSNYIEKPNQTDNIFGFDLYDVFTSSENLSSCYVLGALYLSIDESDAIFNYITAKYKEDPNQNIILNKDISLSEVENIIKYNTDILFPFPTENENNSIELYRYIIDIENFTNNRKTDRFKIYMYDNREPQGLFGLSEEDIYNSLIIGIINGNHQINYLINLELNNIKDLIQKWVNLKGWVENFQNYWSTSGTKMPEELNLFLNNEMGITI